MSVGPPALSTVLVQRLDAVMGTTMAAHANLVSGARPDAVTQPGEASPPGQTDSPTRAPRQAIEQAGARGAHQNPVVDTKTAAALALAARGLVTRNDTTASAPTSLSMTARTILALLAQFPDPPPPAVGKTPLWAPPAAADTAALTPQAGLLAAGLRQALQNTGLFYESHLTDLAFGRRTPEQLRGEPQAALARPGPETDGASATGRTAPGAPASAGAPAPHSRQASATPSHNTPVAPLPQGSGIDQDAALLVRQQLDVLANPTLTWQGHAWPGTPMEWEIRRERQSVEAGPDDDTHWSTRLTLDLPRLGLVQARLNLAGGQLVLQLIAPRSAHEIDASADELRVRLGQAGLTLGNLTVGAMAPPTAPAAA